MATETRGDVLIVRHAGRGAVDDARRLCDATVDHVKTIADAGRRAAILHLSEDVESASEAYARVFAKSFFKIKPYKPVIVAQIDKPVMLAIAKVAMLLARTKVSTFRTYRECVDYLQQQGFRLD